MVPSISIAVHLLHEHLELFGTVFWTDNSALKQNLSTDVARGKRSSFVYSPRDVGLPETSDKHTIDKDDWKSLSNVLSL